MRLSSRPCANAPLWHQWAVRNRCAAVGGQRRNGEVLAPPIAALLEPHPPMPPNLPKISLSVRVVIFFTTSTRLPLSRTRRHQPLLVSHSRLPSSPLPPLSRPSYALMGKRIGSSIRLHTLLHFAHTKPIAHPYQPSLLGWMVRLTQPITPFKSSLLSVLCSKSLK